MALTPQLKLFLEIDFDLTLKMSLMEMKWRQMGEEMMAESVKNKLQEKSDILALRRRWQNAYDLFQKGDFVNAFNVFELIEVCNPDAPPEVSLNKLLSLIASGLIHPIEIKSRLLASHLGPIFLFAVGVYLEEMDPEESLNSFKKCLYTLEDSSALLDKFIVYINLAIMSNIVENKTLANFYLGKAEIVADNEEALKIVRKYKAKGLNSARCVGIPKEFCIPPPKECKSQSWMEIFDEDNDSIGEADRTVDETHKEWNNSDESHEDLGNLSDEDVEVLENSFKAESLDKAAGEKLQISTQTENPVKKSYQLPSPSDEADDIAEDSSLGLHEILDRILECNLKVQTKDQYIHEKPQHRAIPDLLTPPDEHQLEIQAKFSLFDGSASSGLDIQSAETNILTSGGQKIPPRRSSMGKYE
jgi:hypothetical protein